MECICGHLVREPDASQQPHLFLLCSSLFELQAAQLYESVRYQEEASSVMCNSGARTFKILLPVVVS